MQLRLVVKLDGTDHELMVATQPGATVADLHSALVDELGREAGADGPAILWSDRLGQPLEASLAVERAGLREGDRLRFGEREDSRVRGRGFGQLLVVGGPAAGRRIELDRGELTIGRDDQRSDIAIDDPSLSGVHLHVRTSRTAMTVTDLGSRNGTAVEGVGLAPQVPRDLLPGQILRAGRTLLTFEPGEERLRAVTPDEHGQVAFNRPPRLVRPPSEVVVSMRRPPEDPPRSRLPLVASLLPLVFAAVMFSVTPAGDQSRTLYLLFALLTPVMAVGTFIEDRRGARREFTEQARAWRRELEAIGARLTEEREREVVARRTSAPDGPALLGRASLAVPGLWERRPTDSDFLSLRLGEVDQPSLVRVAVEEGGSERLRRDAEKRLTSGTSLPTVPLVADLLRIGSVGLAGEREDVAATARFLVAQLAVLHSYRDVTLVAAVSEAASAEWEWLKWLPHCARDNSLLSGAQVAAGAGGASVVEGLLDLVRRRHDATERQLTFDNRKHAPLPAVVAVIDEGVASDRSAADRLLAHGPAQGVYTIWLGSQVGELPGACGAIADLDRDIARLTWTDVAGHQPPVADVIRSGLEAPVAFEIAHALAPLRDVAVDRSRAEIPARVGLLELLGGARIGPESVAEKWATRKNDVAAPLGRSAAGVYSVDLAHDGPHGLIAGTTGAGKSELLQTLVASLCANHPPTRLTFLLVDYKGGAAFKECTAFPHTVGFVTDLDMHLTRRALISLNAELRYREHVLAAAGAKDLIAMLRSHPDEAPPRLVIVVDEFATLAKEVPDFVEGLVDVAQRGRSLGVHMLLATQRPAGVVTPSIRANTNLRISLRVSDTAESDDVISTPDAARIPRELPGRAYARTGHSELVEFQTAYVGGRILEAGLVQPVVVSRLTFDGQPAPMTRGEGNRPTELPTELQAIVEATAQAAERAGLPAPREPWKPALPAVIPLRPPSTDQPRTGAVVGVVDEPAAQSQRPHIFDIERDGSLLVFGAGGGGKTNLLRTIAVGLSECLSPDELWIYGIDFGSRGLTPLEALPHCGAVLMGDDEERMQRLLSTVRTAIHRRKELFASHGVYGLAELAESAPAVAPPRLLVLIDGFEGFAAAFERVDFGAVLEELPRLISDGRSTGIHFVIAAERRGSVPMTLMSSLPLRVVLRMADEDEYAAFGLPWRTLKEAKLPPGRGFIEHGLEMQSAIVGEDPHPAAQAKAIGEVGERVRSRWPGSAARPIGTLPSHIPLTSLPRGTGPLAGAVGVADADLQPVEVDLVNGNFLVAGPRRSGRSTALATMVQALQATTPRARLVLLAPRRTPLTTLTIWESIATGVEECDAKIQELAEGLARAPRRPLLVFMDDAEELAESVSADDLDRLVAAATEREVRVIVAVEAGSAARMYSSWFTRLRKDEHGLLLDPDHDTDGDLLGARLPRSTGKRMVPGRGYLVVRGEARLVQLAAAVSEDR